MDRSRRENRESREKTFQYKSRQEALLDEELTEDKLAQLLAVVAELDRTPERNAEFQRRVKLFGVCQRCDGEISTDFYARLHHWLHRDIPQTKRPLHPPRQTHGGPTVE
jgi:aminoglycoside phosphotransferase (APT) family kinase protein